MRTWSLRMRPMTSRTTLGSKPQGAETPAPLDTNSGSRLQPRFLDSQESGGLGQKTRRPFRGRQSWGREVRWDPGSWLLGGGEGWGLGCPSSCWEEEVGGLGCRVSQKQSILRKEGMRVWVATYPRSSLGKILPKFYSRNQSF